MQPKTNKFVEAEKILFLDGKEDTIEKMVQINDRWKYFVITENKWVDEKELKKYEETKEIIGDNS